MIENKRYQLRQEQLDYPIMNFCCDLIDTENNDKVICFFDNDIGTSKMVDLLNEQDEEITELKILSTKLYAENVILQTKLDTIKNCVNNLEDD